MKMMESPLRRAFTLVELLVVIAIVALLMAMLLPALQKARETSLRLKNSANIRGMTQGFTVCAHDQKGVLPGIKFSLGTEPYWFRSSPTFDLRPVMTSYNLMPLTANPIFGTPRLDDPGNTSVDLALPWYYLAGTLQGTHDCTVPGFLTSDALAPLKLDNGKSNHVLMQDQLLRYNGTYGASLMKISHPIWNPPPSVNNPSRANHFTTNFDLIAGVYTGTYDGAVTLRNPADARWAGHLLANINIATGHFQPQ